MKALFQVTPDDIHRLSDEDTRTIVALLCEAEMRRLKYSTSAVTWGGNQNASDGGIDVRVSLSSETLISGYIPKAETGFQVKKPEMTASSIKEEMSPNKIIRNSIKELADKFGAYIIVSTGSNVSDSMLESRLLAMKEVVSILPNGNNLTLDFIDRTRLATWVNDDPGRILWVLDKVGRSFSGWKPYGNWGYSPEGLGSEYLLDDKVRLKNGRNYNSEGVTAIKGIENIRSVLNEPRGVVRLVGLSGVGKTRLAQALFEEKIGDGVLDHSLACYTDLSENPSPSPVDFATRLIADCRRSILVVDNCTPELHKKLTEVCRQPESNLSLITIEYDIRDDSHEGTDIFSLEASSEELITKLLIRRYPKISQVDSRKIAEFSGGNARIAIALAETVEDNDSLANLNDEALFIRLFQQRRSEDKDLLIAAKAFSLVYSFSVKDTDDESISELTRLGALIEKSPQFMFRQASELFRRGLLQQRGEWRAILPHAIANRLAKYALQEILPSEIQKYIVSDPAGRLIKSFSRRLAYLHESTEAARIVKNWLNPGGLLFDMTNYDDNKKSIFKNIAPVSPIETLATLERLSISEESPYKIREYLDTIRSLTYDSNLFERCAELLVKIIQADSEDLKKSESLQIFISLFQIRLSGTHASIDQRLDYLKRLISSENQVLQQIGIEGINAMLKTHHFTSFYNFEFGARTRDYGYTPKKYGEYEEWYKKVLSYILNYIKYDEQYSNQLIAIFAKNFRGLWMHLQLDSDLEEISYLIQRKLGFWRDGWLAIRILLTYNVNELPEDSAIRIKALENALKPTDLVQQIRSIALESPYQFILFDDYDSLDGDNTIKSSDRQAEFIRNLGREIGKHEVIFNQLLSELLSISGHQGLLGEGIAQDCPDPELIWQKMLEELNNIPEADRQIMLFRGFLVGLNKRNNAIAESLLDQALQNHQLARYFPFLQTALELNDRSLERLITSLAIEIAPVEQYRNLAFGRMIDTFSHIGAKNLILEIAKKPEGGFNVALEILYFKLFDDQQRKISHSPEMIDTGKELLLQWEVGFRDNMEDNRLELLSKSCLSGDGGATIAKTICKKLIEAFKSYMISPNDFDDLLEGLLTAQPIATLDSFFGDDEESKVLANSFFNRLSSERPNPFDVLDLVSIEKWCGHDPSSRYAQLASLIKPFTKIKDQQIQWTEQALFLLRNATNKIEILRRLIARLIPNAWSGSLAAVIESNMLLLDNLKEFENNDLIIFIQEEKIRLKKIISKERENEMERERFDDERFE
jgi:hypothetical protein